MSSNEASLIKKLHSPESDDTRQKAALAQIGDWLEETYILNLPPSPALLKALNTYAQSTKTSLTLKAKAKKLIKKYGH
jgi:hypothetical protein